MLPVLTECSGWTNLLSFFCLIELLNVLSEDTYRAAGTDSEGLLLEYDVNNLKGLMKVTLCS